MKKIICIFIGKTYNDFGYYIMDEMETGKKKGEIQAKMLLVIKNKEPLKPDELWKETWKSFGLELDDMYTDRWIPEITLRQCIMHLLYRRELILLNDRRLGLP